MCLMPVHMCVSCNSPSSEDQDLLLAIAQEGPWEPVSSSVPRPSGFPVVVQSLTKMLPAFLAPCTFPGHPPGGAPPTCFVLEESGRLRASPKASGPTSRARQVQTRHQGSGPGAAQGCPGMWDIQQVQNRVMMPQSPLVSHNAPWHKHGPGQCPRVGLVSLPGDSPSSGTDCPNTPQLQTHPDMLHFSTAPLAPRLAARTGSHSD